jgi:hypothetical protein|tara:strand:+ start:203 stop:1117 length:915 start_codon:yes stop_codon:yes gene_type:complete
MKKKDLKSIAGLTLLEMLIGVVISSIMMGAIYTTYTVVNNTYSQVTERAKISRSGRDIVEMMMRDIRMAGFKYILGTNTRGWPTRSYLKFDGGNTTIAKSHDPIIIEKGESALGPMDSSESRIAIQGHPDEGSKCCDRIHIVYDDFNQNDENQPYKRYKITYYAAPLTDKDGQRYVAYKSLRSWSQTIDKDDGKWVDDCSECYIGQKIRDHIVDMEFVPLDAEGRVLSPLPRPGSNPEARENLYKIRAVDLRITFRSKSNFYKFKGSKPRFVKGLGDRGHDFDDTKLRDSVVVTIHTRNIGGGL